MGKRKLHDRTYYQCDWTALPMDSPACYMPSFDGKKLKKRGNYCNWESVVAHANHLHEVDKTLEADEYEAVVEHVYELTGTNIDPRDYHYACETATDLRTASGGRTLAAAQAGERA